MLVGSRINKTKNNIFTDLKRNKTFKDLFQKVVLIERVLLRFGHLKIKLKEKSLVKSSFRIAVMDLNICSIKLMEYLKSKLKQTIIHVKLQKELFKVTVLLLSALNREAEQFQFLYNKTI